MNGEEFAALFGSGPLLSDGGMGASLVERGVPLNACFELLNTDDPDLVEGVHRAFVDAGARIVVTNTFGANRFALDRHGLRDRVEELNRMGVEVARRAGVLVAGSVGPLRVRLVPYGRVPSGRGVRGVCRADLGVGGGADRPHLDRDPL